jgi:hypothetical protein
MTGFAFQEGLVRKTIATILIVLASAASALAQTKITMSGKCGKPDVQQMVPAADAPDHMMTLAQGKCVPTKAAEFGGSPSKEAAFAEHGELIGQNGKVTGTYVDTLANGEKVYYSYQGTSVLQNGALQSMENKWKIVGGTARLKGIKGQGTCTGKGTSDGGLTFDCTGEYSLP